MTSETIDDLEHAYNEAQKLADTIKQQWEQKKKDARNAEIKEIADAMTAAGITLEELAEFLGKPLRSANTTETKAPAAKTTGAKTPGEPKAERADLPPKYRNPETGETWTGRGKPVLSIKLKRIKYRNPANPSETWHGWEEFGQAPAWYAPGLPEQKNAAGKDLYPDDLLIINQ